MRLILAAVTVCVALGCGAPDGEGPTRDPEAQRARDSAIGASRLPGAGGVRGALRASDSASARRARLDSLSREP